MRTAPGTEAASTEAAGTENDQTGTVVTTSPRVDQAVAAGAAHGPAAVSLEARTRSGEGRRAPRSVENQKFPVAREGEDIQ